MRSRSARLSGLAVAVATIGAFCATGCGGTDDGGASEGRVHIETREVQQELRPTEESDPFGYEGAETQSIVSPGGEFRVWWADDGAHAVPAEDADASGVPDYVEMVADVADEVAARLEEGDWKIAMNDDSGAGATPLGGDGRFDIYLVDFSNGDGHYSGDWCRQNEHGVDQCAGHFRLENDFAGLNYPSAEYAARLVLSHEYFHAVQNAYTAELPAWWSEGSATWFEELFDAEQDDFERLTSLYFDEHTRTLNDRGRGPSDGFSYGASIFVYFLELHIGEEGVRAIFERLAQGEALMDALEAELSARFVALDEAFDLFATYNLFTDDLAVSDNGYPDAQRFWGVDVQSQQVDEAFNWNLDADPLAARYAKLTFDAEISLAKASIDGFAAQPQLIAVNSDEYAADGAMHIIGADQPTRFGPEMSPLFVVVSNGHTDERRAATLKVRLPAADDGGEDNDEDSDGGEQTPEVDDSGDGGCAVAGGGGPAGALGLICFGLFVVLRRFVRC
jgi:hypothetical protein